MPGAPITVDYMVRYDDIDFTNKAFLPAIINYFTDLATLQAFNVGLDVDTLKTRNRGWVICQWDIDIDRLPTYNETISVTTIPYSFKKFFAFRLFTIKDAKGNTIIRGKSKWMLIDTEKRAPVRLTHEDLLAFKVSEGDDEIIEVTKPSKVKEFSIDSVFDVRYADIDTNNHVNNSKYITWALETLDIDFLGSHVPSNVKILYGKEKRYGGSIHSKAEVTQEETNTHTYHAICDENDLHLCDIEILWN
ncbi:MAG: thioesterase [Clostridium sp.]|uniref:acyl-[acyl-carrier-protein] thioesterase n=2 Tax=Clostridium sp. TaxID=1506 RepID=UPI002FCB753B